MIPGVHGTLLSHEAIEHLRMTVPPAGEHAAAVRREIARWHSMTARHSGPAWSARLVLDRIAIPFCEMFGLGLTATGSDARVCRGIMRRDGEPIAAVVTTAWGQAQGLGWRDSIRAALPAGSRWCCCFTGPDLRIFDAARTHSRRFLLLDLEEVATRNDTFALTWRLLADAGALEAAVTASERHRVQVRESLQNGVQDALTRLTAAFAVAAQRGRRSSAAPTVVDESLVVIYRVLFLLFAEARGLVPMWHATFRESYSLEAMRDSIEQLPRPRGVWDSLQAIARLAHRGCRAGPLRVAPFNGRLFSPTHAPLAAAAPLDDAAVRGALLSLTTRKTADGRQRISYADLDVEHLGGVYERVLDYDVTASGARVATGRRKATGTFYTPRPLTEYLVRRTLAPLVHDRSPEDILSLRILDPAMGSGAFLVAACRYLASAYESALVRDGAVSPADLTDADRAGFRRTIAQRTLYGVDLNPMAVQLARLSLWLATLAGDRPLTFFDHHLRVGNSLVGAGVTDVLSRTSGRTRRREPALPLLDALDAFGTAVGTSVASAAAIRDGREDTLAQVRTKEALFTAMQSDGAPLHVWKAIVDLWCSSWFAERPRQHPRQLFAALLQTARGHDPALPDGLAKRVLAEGRAIAERERFFHWPLEFPEVFFASDGTPAATAGFDAVLGNPPWEMLRGDSGDADARTVARRSATSMTTFARGSGLYRFQGSGHANLYQLFVERALMLLRQGGRCGLVLPSGVAADHGCAGLRRHLLDATTIDSWVMVENRAGLFPIHRGLKFVLMTLTRSGSTTAVPVRAGISAASQFDELPHQEKDEDAVPVTRALIERFCGPSLAVPDVRCRLDADLAARAAFTHPALGDPQGWDLHFGRELNATEDRQHFSEEGDLPVVEGKQILPFAVDVSASRLRIGRLAARRLLRDSSFDRPRLAYRDVASATNRLTLIAGILPANAVSTHTVFCLKTAVEEPVQLFVLGLFNSFVVNFLVRLRVTTHVTVSIVEQLPLPKLAQVDPDFQAMTRGARRLLADPSDPTASARLQALAARLYGLDREGFAHVLSTFPLVEERARTAAMDAFLSTL